jgi:antitoxin (DNA-binding transcriptional repressor) of toxin-antitoxin stability system
MRRVDAAELAHELKVYLQLVKDGEEIVIHDHSVPVARLMPLRQAAGYDEEATLVAAGALKMPEEAMDWERFFLAAAGNVAEEIAVEAVLASRGDR